MQRIHISRLVNKYGDDYQVFFYCFLIFNFQDIQIVRLLGAYQVTINYYYFFIIVLAEYVDGYKAKCHAAFCWDFTQTLHQVLYVSK